MDHHHLQKFLLVKHFWYLGSNTKHCNDFCLYFPMSFRLGSFCTCLYCLKRYTSLQLLNPLCFACLRVEVVVLPDVLSTSAVQIQEKALSELSLILPDTLTDWWVTLEALLLWTYWHWVHHRPFSIFFTPPLFLNITTFGSEKTRRRSSINSAFVLAMCGRDAMWWAWRPSPC